MALVGYSDSDDSEIDKTSKQYKNTRPINSKESKRKTSSAEQRPSDLPPLPDSFHDLYASNTRSSKQDDPDLHAGRQRQIPHVEGQWPTHVYIEWHPSRSEIDTLSNVLSQAEKKLPLGIRLQSLLTSNLGADLPLHISLSRTLMLATHQRQPFAEDLEKAISASGVKPFTVVLDSLCWVANHEHNRWFLVTQAQTPTSDALNILLTASNETAGNFGQPRLYAPQEVPTASNLVRSKNRKGGVDRSKHIERPLARTLVVGQPSAVDEKLSEPFHISIGWTLEEPFKSTLSEANEAVCEQGPMNLRLVVRFVKVKIGNGVVAIPLATRAVGSNGIVGT